ncbi:MAG: YceK/YidQ family lipoprotein [Arthrospira platensis PCC 7345]|nr:MULTISPECIES: YceK/YidQ family lipoprotein [unclassified Limnospira]MDT9201222.1 YceK/YidQ family lipoprotein [Limnospira sp. PMC 1042.18]MDT9297993.1 YceK/YidQ family lipoprotein [Arthrospira platensis PCC 7345]MDT9190889.1 YceK/YidQ family lipoprotein [Limnospira sp. PMC 894.15]MDT9206190.1 YceK/YidQ family lipoprotein [Limnospira sp. PMC 1243.20]MDT9282738.1 YceK/YidQ family lipoprotein [Limnospira sp. PMC 1293.21]
MVRTNSDFKGRIYPATTVSAFGMATDDPGQFTQAAVSLPFDFIIDTVLLPYDVICFFLMKSEAETKNEIRDNFQKMVQDVADFDVAEVDKSREKGRAF